MPKRIIYKRLFLSLTVIAVGCYYLNKAIAADMENLGISIVTAVLGTAAGYLWSETKRKSE